MDLDASPSTDYPYELLCEHVGIDLFSRDSLQPRYVFYPYPNSSEDDRDIEKWGSRSTRLVVRASLAGRTTYYPVTFDRVRPNTHYHVEMVIAGFGVDHPENNPDDHGSMSLTVSTDPWIAGTIYEAEL